MAQTFAEQMVEKLQTALLANPTAQSVNVDGNSVTYREAEKLLARYERRVAREAGYRPVAAQINVGDR